jgi:hypothetical protein
MQEQIGTQLAYLQPDLRASPLALDYSAGTADRPRAGSSRLSADPVNIGMTKDGINVYFKDCRHDFIAPRGAVSDVGDCSNRDEVPRLKAPFGR